MSWFEDLTPYAFLRHHDARETHVRTLNIGWLEKGRPFSKGTVPSAAIERLRQLVEFAATQATRGLHFCDLCPETDDPEAWQSRSGHAEVRVHGADGTRYAAPVLVLHYVTVHQYAPPQAFVEGLLRLAQFRWDEARDRTLCFSCGASLRQTRVDNDLVRIVDGKREPVTSVWFDCETCGTSYNRSSPR
jgi:hypothetical protein